MGLLWGFYETPLGPLLGSFEAPLGLPWALRGSALVPGAGAILQSRARGEHRVAEASAASPSMR